MNPYLVFFYPVFAVSSWFLTFCHECVLCNGRRRPDAALKDFVAAGERLAQWRAARPFLFVSQSAYARSIVMTMIESYRIMLDYDHGHELDGEVLKDLYDLLNDTPPSHDPSPADEEARPAGFLFHLSPDRGGEGFDLDRARA